MGKPLLNLLALAAVAVLAGCNTIPPDATSHPGIAGSWTGTVPLPGQGDTKIYLKISDDLTEVRESTPWTTVTHPLAYDNVKHAYTWREGALKSIIWTISPTAQNDELYTVYKSPYIHDASIFRRPLPNTERVDNGEPRPSFWDYLPF